MRLLARISHQVGERDVADGCRCGQMRRRGPRAGERCGLASSVLLSLPGLALPPQATPPKEHRSGVWISREEILSLPERGPAWETLLAAVRQPLPEPDLSGRDDNCDVL